MINYISIEGKFYQKETIKNIYNLDSNGNTCVLRVLVFYPLMAQTVDGHSIHQLLLDESDNKIIGYYLTGHISQVTLWDTCSLALGQYWFHVITTGAGLKTYLLCREIKELDWS